MKIYKLSPKVWKYSVWQEENKNKKTKWINGIKRAKSDKDLEGT